MYQPLNKGIKSKRTGKNTVALVGFAKTSRDATPWDDEDTEIWGLNEAGIQDWFKRWTRWFQIHPEDNFSRKDNHNDPNHLQWLENARGFPIYMQKHFDNIPESVELPLDDIIERYGNYLTSSLAYMLTLAMLEGFERIELYGFELGTRTEYHYQKANAEYLIGLARGLGFEIYIPPVSSMCKGKMYGYEDMTVVFRQKLENRLNAIIESHKESQDKAMTELGALEMVKKFHYENLENEEIKRLYEDQGKIARMALAEVNFTIGAREEVKGIIGMYDEFLEVIGVAPKQDYTKSEKVNDG